MFTALSSLNWFLVQIAECREIAKETVFWWLHITGNFGTVQPGLELGHTGLATSLGQFGGDPSARLGTFVHTKLAAEQRG